MMTHLLDVQSAAARTGRPRSRIIVRHDTISTWASATTASTPDESQRPRLCLPSSPSAAQRPEGLRPSGALTQI